MNESNNLWGSPGSNTIHTNLYFFPCSSQMSCKPPKIFFIFSNLICNQLRTDARGPACRSDSSHEDLHQDGAHVHQTQEIQPPVPLALSIYCTLITTLYLDTKIELQRCSQLEIRLPCRTQLTELQKLKPVFMFCIDTTDSYSTSEA